MLGAIIGDIAGSRFEFDPTNDYNFELFTSQCSYTDDTICTIAVADAILSEHNRQGQDIPYGEYIHRWCRKYPHPMGGYGISFRKWEASDHPQPYNSFGNGAAMRVSPVAWFYPDSADVQKNAIGTARCTHNHPEGLKGAEAVAMTIHRALEYKMSGQPLTQNDIDDALARGWSMYPNMRQLHLADHRNLFDETCQGTVPVALKIVEESHSFEEAIRKAVSLGADADTLGAIVGSIAEAIWGIPEWMKEKALTYLPEDMRKVLLDFRKACPA